MPTPPSPGRPRDGEPPWGKPAPLVRDPDSAKQVSDKSGLVAGLLQLFFGCFGAGRFYLGLTSIAILQLGVGLFGLFATLVGFKGLPFLLGAAVWGVVDAMLIFAGSVKDRYGRDLRR